MVRHLFSPSSLIGSQGSGLASLPREKFGSQVGLKGCNSSPLTNLGEMGPKSARIRKVRINLILFI